MSLFPIYGLCPKNQECDGGRRNAGMALLLIMQETAFTLDHAYDVHSIVSTRYHVLFPPPSLLCRNIPVAPRVGSVGTLETLRHPGRRFGFPAGVFSQTKS